MCNFQKLVIMQKQEFEKLVGYEVDQEVYQEIEALYMAAGNIDKDEFCKEFKEHKLNRCTSIWEVVKTLKKVQGDLDFEKNQNAEIREKMEKALMEKGLRWDEDSEVLVEVPAYERIKTLEDAMKATGMSLPEDIDELPVDIRAYMKLRIIVAAMNGLTKDSLDEFPKFSEDEYRYYPWFWFYKSREEAIEDGCDEDDIVDIPALVGGAYGGSHCGVSPLRSHYVASRTDTDCGGALVMCDRDRTIYCAKQFIVEWVEFYTRREVQK